MLRYGPCIGSLGSITLGAGGGVGVLPRRAGLEVPPPILVDTEQNKYRQLNNMNSVADISPKPPAPLYPDVPWWAVLITAFVFAAAGVLVGVYGMKGFSADAVKGSVGSSIVVDTVSYIPHILLLFGVLADMFTLDGVWSIPSLIGVLSIFANYIFQYFWKGIDELVKTAKGVATKATATAPTDVPVGGKGRLKGGAEPLFKDYKGCNVQGFGGLSTPYAPQTLVVTATVFSYYCYDLVRNRGWINSLGGILGFAVAYIGQTAVIDYQNSDTGGCGGQGVSTFMSSLRALFEGFLFGGVGYGIVQTYAPTRLPSSTISPFPRKSVSDLSPGPDGRMYDADGYPYIVLPNGQAIPDLSDAQARGAFGSLVNDATGVTSSLGSNCPGQKTTCPGDPQNCPCKTA